MGGKGSGRKSINADTAEIQKTMTEAGVEASHLVKAYIKGKDTHGNKVSITMVKLTACLQSIAHAIGLPRQKVTMTHTGELLTLKDLAELAEQYDLVSGADCLQSGAEAVQDRLQPTVKLIPKTPESDKN